MYAYTLSRQETKDWEEEDAVFRDDVRSHFRVAAKIAARDYGYESAEIHSNDGIVLDTVMVDE